MIDPSQFQFIIMDGRGCNPFLREWLCQFPHVRFASSLRYDGIPESLGIWRNNAIRWFQDETALPWLVMFDDDMIPVMDTQALLESPADITGAPYINRHGRPAHGSREGQIGAAAVKISRRVFDVIPPPWFRMVDAEDGLGVKQCECVFFCEKARHFGFHPVRAGRIGHRASVVLLPHEDNPERAVLKFENDALFRGPGQWVNPSEPKSNTSSD